MAQEPTDTEVKKAAVAALPDAPQPQPTADLHATLNQIRAEAGHWQMKPAGESTSRAATAPMTKEQLGHVSPAHSKPSKIPSEGEIYLKTGDDDYAHFITGGLTASLVYGQRSDGSFRRYDDMGIRSGQVSAGVSVPFRKGSLAVEASDTVFTGGHGNSTIEPADGNKPINDGYQAPGGENFNVSAEAKMPVRDGREHITTRIDAGYVTKTKYLQEWFHSLPFTGAPYFRSHANTVQPGPQLNVEVGGDHSLISKRHFDARLIGGTALTASYKVGVNPSGMGGVELELHSPNGKCLPQTTSSARYGNTEMDHLVTDCAIKPGAWKLTLTAKGFVSGTNDVRASTSKDNPITHDQTKNVAVDPHDFGDQYLGEAYEKYPPGSVNDIWSQWNVITHDFTSIQVKQTAPLTGYSFSPLNEEAKLKLNVQITKHLSLDAALGIASNPIHAKAKSRDDISNATQAEYLRLSNQYKRSTPLYTSTTYVGDYGELSPFTDAKTGTIAYIARPYYAHASDFSTFSYGIAQTSVERPHYNPEGEFSLHYRWGGAKKDNGPTR